jgi:hypothetical protein
MLEFFLSPVPRGIIERYKNTRIDREFPEILAYLELWGSNTTILWTLHIALFLYLGQHYIGICINFGII